MKRLLIIIGVVAGLYAAYAIAYPTYSYRFRLILDVDTPSGLKTGSSVISLTWRSQMPIGPRSAVTQVKGEAAIVDLGGGKHVIAILGFGPKGTQDKLEHLAFEAFRRAKRPMDIKALAKAQGSAPLTGDLVPTFVTFTDLNDPKTARVVRPDDFPAVFGAGVRFRDARIEMTTDPATKGIEEMLPWLSRVEQYRTDPKNPFTNTLSFGRQLFIRES
jgi:hypothetical protein